MLSTSDFIRNSLETNLFFARITKEHVMQGANSFVPLNEGLVNQFRSFQSGLEEIINEALPLSQGVVSREFVEAYEAVTPFTAPAERATVEFVGMKINTDLTIATANSLSPTNYAASPKVDEALAPKVEDLNAKALALAEDVFKLHTQLLDDIVSGRTIAWIYPQMLDHIAKEAKFYVETLKMLRDRKDITAIRHANKQETFWNNIMSEHAKFMRSLLDQSQNFLIETSDKISDKFDGLFAMAKKTLNDMEAIAQVTDLSLEAVEDLQKFKVQEVKGVLSKEIQGIIFPLLVDHALRETNHYLRILQNYSEEFNRNI